MAVPASDDQQIRRDGLLAAIFCGTSFIAIGLSFAVTTPHGHPVLLATMIGTSGYCLWKAQHKLAVLATAAAFLLVRVLWGMLMAGSF